MISAKKLFYKTIQKIASHTSQISTHTTQISTLSNDYITSKGSSSSWRYRKWNSGKIEATYGYEGSGSVFTVWNGNVRYKDVTVSIPSGVFGNTPTRVLATSASNQCWVVSANATSATSISIRFATVSSASTTPYAYIYAIYL